MYELDVGGSKLTVDSEKIWFGRQWLHTKAIEGMQVVSTNFTLYLFLVFPVRRTTRVIRLRASTGRLEINLAGLPNIEAVFDRVMEAVWQAVGVRLVESALSRLCRGETITLAGIDISKNGVWVEGGWTGASKKLVPWLDLRTFRTNGELILSSRSNPRYRSDIRNQKEDAMILDSVVRYILSHT